MIKKVIVKDHIAREKLAKGINEVADLLGRTIGPGGRNIVLDRYDIFPVISNDGVEVAEDVMLDDEIEDAGAKLAKKISMEANKISGDGTTTTAILLNEIVKAGMEKMKPEAGILKSKYNAMEIKRQIDNECKIVLDKLKPKKATKKDLINVATISAENKEIGEMIANLISEIGEDGLVNIEDGGEEVTGKVIEGIEFDYGFLSEKICNDLASIKAKNIEVYVSEDKIDTVDKLVGIIEPTQKRGKSEIAVFAKGFAPEVKEAIINVFNTFKVYAVEIPINTDHLEDIKAITAGHADNLFINRRKTIIIGGKGNVKTHIAKLKEEAKDNDAKEKIEQRIARILSRVAHIKVGGHSDIEINYLTRKIEDAVNATRNALKNGVVKGGGIALKELADKVELIKPALEAPYNKIQENAGGNLEIGEDVLDSYTTVKTSLQKACSAAGIILTTDAVIANKHEVDKQETE